MGSNLSHNSIFKEQPVFPPGKAFPLKGQKTREPIFDFLGNSDFQIVTR